MAHTTETPKALFIRGYNDAVAGRDKATSFSNFDDELHYGSGFGSGSDDLYSDEVDVAWAAFEYIEWIDTPSRQPRDDSGNGF